MKFSNTKLNILICLCIFMCCCILLYCNVFYNANYSQVIPVILHSLTEVPIVDSEVHYVSRKNQKDSRITKNNVSSISNIFSTLSATPNWTTNKNVDNIYIVNLLHVTGLDKTPNRTANQKFRKTESTFTGLGDYRIRSKNKNSYNEVITFSGYGKPRNLTANKNANTNLKENTFRWLQETDIIVHKDKDNTIKHFMFWTNASFFDDIICKSDTRLTSCKYSKLKLLNVDTSTQTIEVGIYLYDGTNKVKQNGGDVIFVWAEKLPSGGKAAGHVVDHMNGSYTGRVRIHWSGQTKVFVKLASAKENQCLRLRAMQKYGNSVFALKTPYGIHYRFVKHHPTVTEFTRCYPHSDVYGYKSVCNFTSLNYGLSWFCGKPTKPGLGCGNYNMFEMKPYIKSIIVPEKNRDEVIWVPGHCVFDQRIDVRLIGNPNMSVDIPQQLVKCSNRPKLDSWTEPRPTGYSISDNWQFNNCLYSVKYETRSLIQCLKGKIISFIGDSTLRQYLEVLAHIMNLQIHSSGIAAEFNLSAHSINHDGIHLTWRKHEMPFHNMHPLEQSKVQSSTFQLDTIANDNSLKGNESIVVVHYSAHLQAFPPSVYRSRIRSLVEALRRLLDKKPETTILVKGASPVMGAYH